MRAALGEDLVANDHLRHSRRVAQVKESHAAVITTSGHPPGQGDDLRSVVGAQGAGLVSAKHGEVPRFGESMASCWFRARSSRAAPDILRNDDQR